MLPRRNSCALIEEFGGFERDASDSVDVVETLEKG